MMYLQQQQQQQQQQEQQELWWISLCGWCAWHASLWLCLLLVSQTQTQITMAKVPRPSMSRMPPWCVGSPDVLRVFMLEALEGNANTLASSVEGGATAVAAVDLQVQPDQRGGKQQRWGWGLQPFCHMIGAFDCCACQPSTTPMMTKVDQGCHLD
jgi:hypothetical protein